MTENVFEIIVNKLVELGFYDYLFPFVITATLLYALLKKSKIMGESVTASAALALSIAFMIFGFPILAGYSLATPLSTFFLQTTVWILMFLVGFILASFFYPDLGKFLTEQFTRRTTLWAMVAIGITLFVTSGLVNVFTAGMTTRPGVEPISPQAPQDVVLIVAAVVIFIVLLLIAGSTLRSSSQ